MMLITIREYAGQNGKSIETIKMHLRAGHFSTAVKEGKLWKIDNNEPYPKPQNLKDGKYIGWRGKHPIKNKGSRPRTKKPVPIRRVYGVLIDVEILKRGLYIPADTNVLSVSYDFWEAMESFSLAKVTADEDNKRTIETRAAVRLMGYKLHCERGATARQAWDSADECGEMTNANMIYMLSDHGEWVRPKYEVK